MSGELKAVIIIDKNNHKANNVGQVDLIKTGIPNDIHINSANRQISILPYEEVIKLDSEYEYGKYNENLVISNIDFKNLKVDDTLTLGDARLKITQIGADKEHKKPESRGIHKLFIFANVLVEGIITAGDKVYID